MRVHELIRKGSDMFHLYDFLIYCFITAYTPGANNLLAMSNAIRLGFRRSLRFLFGIVAGFTAVMFLCTAFSATLYSLLPKVKLVMQILGAAYMLYLARKVWKSSADLETGGGKETGFLSGMVLQFANPKIYIYAITAMSLYILPVYQTTLSLVRRHTLSDRSLRLFYMGNVWRRVLQILFQARQTGQYRDGPSSSLLRCCALSLASQFARLLFTADGQTFFMDDYLISPAMVGSAMLTAGM